MIAIHDLQIFIMDNLGLDTIATPITMYSQAELLVFQNRERPERVFSPGDFRRYAFGCNTGPEPKIFQCPHLWIH